MLSPRTLALVSAVTAGFVACRSQPANVTPANCPAGWVGLTGGGCGPRVLVCEPGGGAAEGVCADGGVSDGGDGSAPGLFRGADGAIRGGWHEPGEPDGPPRADWQPTLGDIARADWSPPMPPLACPTNWRAAGQRECDPQLPSTCPMDTGALPGGACTETGVDQCGTDDFPNLGTEPGTSTVMHVRAGADPATANGDSARPFATIGAAIATGGDGAWIRIAAGRYSETIDVANTVHLVGVCASRVTLEAAVHATRLTARGSVARMFVRGMTISGPGIGVAVSAGARLVLEHTRIVGAEGAGVDAIDARTQVDVDHVVVADAVPNTEGFGGSAFVAARGAALTLRHVHSINNSYIAVAASGSGTQLTMTDSLVRATRPVRSAYGWGVRMSQGAAVLRRVVLIENSEVAVEMANSGTTLDGEDVVALDTRMAAAGMYGQGLEVGTGAVATVRRLRVERSSHIGVNVFDARSILTLEDSVIRGTMAPRISDLGYGVFARRGGSLQLRRSIVESNDNVGVAVFDAGSRAVVEDCVIRRSRARRDGAWGNGIAVRNGAQIELRRTLLAENNEGGLTVGGNTMTTATVEDVVIRDTRSVAGSMGGIGVGLAEAGQMTARRLRISASIAAGMEVLGPGTHLDLEDAVVDGGMPVANGTFGHGIDVGNGASAAIRRVRIADNTSAGLVSDGAGSLVDVADSVIVRTRVGARGGTGLGVLNDGTATVVRVGLYDNGALGAGAFTDGASIELRDVVIASTGAPPAETSHGLQANEGARIVARGLVIDGTSELAVLVYGDRSSFIGSDVAIRHTRSNSAGQAGWAINAHTRATIELHRAFIDDGREMGIVAVHQGTNVTLEDLVLQHIVPTTRAMGAGIMLFDGAAASLARVAITDVSGAALTAVVVSASHAPTMPIRTVADWLFIRNVRSSPIGSTGTMPGLGPPVAYALHVGVSHILDVQHAVLDGGGYGFYASAGSLRLRATTIANQLDAFGATVTNTQATLDVADVVQRSNARNDVVRRDDLPTAVELPSPTPVETP